MGRCRISTEEVRLVGKIPDRRDETTKMMYMESLNSWAAYDNAINIGFVKLCYDKTYDDNSYTPCLADFGA